MHCSAHRIEDLLEFCHYLYSCLRDPLAQPFKRKKEEEEQENYVKQWLVLASQASHKENLARNPEIDQTYPNVELTFTLKTNIETKTKTITEMKLKLK